MDMSNAHRVKTGAFYTPEIWANKAVEYIKSMIPNIEDYFFWDMAAGEGALLESLPEKCEKYGTTLEYEDVAILREKGFNSNRFDFLNGDINNLLDIQAVPKDKLIIFTNPPYVKLPAANPTWAQKKYKTNDATALFFYRIILEIKPLMLCSFHKMDIYQAPIQEDFRAKTNWYYLPKKLFISPSSSWGLKGNFPIGFTAAIL